MGVAGLGLDVRNKTKILGRRLQDPSGDPDRSTDPSGLLPWARADLRAWGSLERCRAVGTGRPRGPICHRWDIPSLYFV